MNTFALANVTCYWQTVLMFRPPNFWLVVYIWKFSMVLASVSLLMHFLVNCLWHWYKSKIGFEIDRLIGNYGPFGKLLGDPCFIGPATVSLPVHVQDALCLHLFHWKLNSCLHRPWPLQLLFPNPDVSTKVSRGQVQLTYTAKKCGRNSLSHTYCIQHTHTVSYIRRHWVT